MTTRTPEPAVPGLEELEEMVARMEARLAAIGTPEGRRLMALYRDLSARFAADLADPRDVALSRGAALMLLRWAAEKPDEKG
jgi:hypothetical protein